MIKKIDFGYGNLVGSPSTDVKLLSFCVSCESEAMESMPQKKDVRDQMSYAEFLIKMLMVKWWSWIENHRRSDENVANADNWQSFSMRCNKNTGFGENNHSFSTRLALESSTRWIDKILWTRGIFDVVSCLGVYCHCTMYVYVSVCVCICNNTERFATCAIGHLSMSSCQ